MTAQTIKRPRGRPRKTAPKFTIDYTDKYPENSLRDEYDIVSETLEVIKPPKRITVSESAKQMRITSAQGSALYELETAPYMVEPMNCLTDRQYESVIFVGPQRSSKSLSLIDAFIHHVCLNDPADMMVVFPSQSMARDFSIRRLSRLITENKELQKKITAATDDNIFDKRFSGGNLVTLAWAAISQLRQRDIQYGIATELDSLDNPQDVEGAGDLFGLLKKRSETFLSSGRTVIESAPSRPVNMEAMTDYEKTSDHDCYPSDGISLLYMQGDKRRLYWECLNPECKSDIEASMKNLTWDELPSIRESSETVRLVCPKCGHVHSPNDKYELNRNLLAGRGGWRLAIDYVTGDPIKSKSASFWMEGVAAAFNTWQEIVYAELQALNYYYDSGDTTTLKQTRNSDQGLQFIPPDWESSKNSQILKNRAEDTAERTVPDEVHFLVTTIDQQKRRFVVQVQGYGRHGESWLIDRYNVDKSPSRVAADGKHLGIEPGSYAEDWDALLPVIEKTYKTQAGADMPSVRVLIDTGGADSATQNAYSFWRKWVKQASEKDQVVLIKGQESGERFRRSENVLKASGVPLYLLNVNSFKDEVAFALAREVPGPNYVHIPSWLPDWFYDELQSEQQDPRTGRWKKRKAKIRNEAFDLMGYAKAAFSLLKAEHIDWDNPPDWATPAHARLKLMQEKQFTQDINDFVASLGR